MVSIIKPQYVILIWRLHCFRYIINCDSSEVTCVHRHYCLPMLSFIKFDPAVAAIQRACPGNEKRYLEL